MKKIKVVIITSTKGSILRELIKNNISDRVYEVISDRNCSAIELAKKNKIKTHVYKTVDMKLFSDYIYNRYKDKKIDFYLIFFTKILEGKLLVIAKNKIINSHPALLPTFKGLNAFKKSYYSKNKYYGPTIHFVDKGIDTGTIISKIKLKKNKINNLNLNRNMVFLLSIGMILQFIKNFETKEIKILKNKTYILNKNKLFKYSNKLDKDLLSYFK